MTNEERVDERGDETTDLWWCVWFRSARLDHTPPSEPSPTHLPLHYPNSPLMAPKPDWGLLKKATLHVMFEGLGWGGRKTKREMVHHLEMMGSGNADDAQAGEINELTTQQRAATRVLIRRRNKRRSTTTGRGERRVKTVFDGVEVPTLGGGSAGRGRDRDAVVKEEADVGADVGTEEGGGGGRVVKEEYDGSWQGVMKVDGRDYSVQWQRLRD